MSVCGCGPGGPGTAVAEIRGIEYAGGRPRLGREGEEYSPPSPRPNALWGQQKTHRSAWQKANDEGGVQYTSDGQLDSLATEMETRKQVSNLNLKTKGFASTALGTGGPAQTDHGVRVHGSESGEQAARLHRAVSAIWPSLSFRCLDPRDVMV